MIGSLPRIFILRDNSDLLLIIVSAYIDVAVLEVAILNYEILHDNLPLTILSLKRSARI
jgi:hypothetical protein